MVKKVSNIINEFVEEIDSHRGLLLGIAEALEKSIEKVNERNDEITHKIKSLEQEKTLVNSNLKSDTETYDKNSTELLDIEVKLTEQDSILKEFNETTKSLNQRFDELTLSTNELSKKLDESKKQLEEKTQTKNDLMNSIDEKVQTNQDKLDSAKKVESGLAKKYVALQYLFSKIEAPEIEILAIIASNRPIGMDEIKSKAVNVVPIFVGRAISKLEADGKIIANGELWDLAPSIVEKL